jgi:hypothetical protein
MGMQLLILSKESPLRFLQKLNGRHAATGGHPPKKSINPHLVNCLSFRSKAVLALQL